jgi:hypothetical protein
MSNFCGILKTLSNFCGILKNINMAHCHYFAHSLSHRLDEKYRLDDHSWV